MASDRHPINALPWGFCMYTCGSHLPILATGSACRMVCGAAPDDGQDEDLQEASESEEGTTDAEVPEACRSSCY